MPRGRVNVDTKDCDRKIEMHTRRCHRIKERALHPRERINSTGRIVTVVWAKLCLAKESTSPTNKTDK